MKYTCLLVDDENLALRLLEDYVNKIPQLTIVGKCQNALSALQILQTQQIDILFLDIQMPDLTGIELIKILKNKPEIILTTAYAEHALEGYQLDVTDYLLKPIPFERFVQAVNKAMEYRNLRNAGVSNLNVSSAPVSTAAPALDYMFVKSDYKQIKVPYADILYIEGLREYVSIYTKEKRIVTLETLKNLELTLPAQQFLRIHKSYIINTTKVEALNGNMVEMGKIKVPIGKNYREATLRLLKQ